MNGVGSTSIDEVDLLSMDNDHGIETQCATQGDHEIDQGEYGDRPSTLDADLTGNRSEVIQSGKKKASENERSLKIDETETTEAPVYYHVS